MARCEALLGHIENRLEPGMDVAAACLVGCMVDLDMS